MKTSVPQSQPTQLTNDPTLPDWGMAAQGLYKQYHFLSSTIQFLKEQGVSEGAWLPLQELQQMMQTTLMTLVEKLPDASSESEEEFREELQRHTLTLQEVSLNVEQKLATLQNEYPVLRDWIAAYPR